METANGTERRTDEGGGITRIEYYRIPKNPNMAARWDCGGWEYLGRWYASRTAAKRAAAKGAP